jgi:hypothetical protein
LPRGRNIGRGKASAQLPTVEPSPPPERPAHRRTLFWRVSGANAADEVGQALTAVVVTRSEFFRSVAERFLAG